MIVAGSGLRVVVATRPVDFRKGHDGLVAVVEHELGLDPYSGIVFVFRPKRADRITSNAPRTCFFMAMPNPMPQSSDTQPGKTFLVVLMQLGDARVAARV